MSVNSEHLTEAELQAQIDETAKIIEVGSLYAHYRDPNGHYKVLGFGTLEATQEPAVIYQKQFGSSTLKSVVWIRAVSSWLEKVSFEGKMVPRFYKIS